ncbi:MAG: hypothetical protein ACRDS1_06055 [Pseudonocardiaceae bacterium]
MGALAEEADVAPVRIGRVSLFAGRGSPVAAAVDTCQQTAGVFDPLASWVVHACRQRGWPAVSATRLPSGHRPKPSDRRAVDGSVDPFGKASICKVGREPQISLLDEGAEGLSRLGGIADGLLLRQAGCTGCALSGTCGTCMPLVTLFRKANAPLANYCQHTEERN